MRLIYLAHEYSGRAANLARARRWLKWVSEHAPGVVPLANWILICELFPGEVPADVEREMARNCMLVSRCDELWLVGGGLSAGMKREAAAARDAGVPVKDFMTMTGEPPEDE